MKIDLITPSYAPDYDRCRALCESMETYVSGIERHLLIVDYQDLKLFKRLESQRCSVIAKEDILPPWLHTLPWSRRWWMSTRTIPLRGWILQQIVKLSAAEWSEADVFMFGDSDAFFIRPFDAASTLLKGNVRLYRGKKKPADYHDRRHNNWDQVAASLFSLQVSRHRDFDYISQMNTWRRDVLIQLLERIEQRTGKPWKQALCNTWDFSEYVLYGVFADHVLGVEHCGHYIDQNEVCNCSWHHDIENEVTVKNFITCTPENQPAVLVQSNLGIRPQDYTATVA
ncbi:DUF6492 family protein [Gammaproteobacteria bacterium]|nr:DUF6492 family protein [Gammaproteobacteria bacterium]